MVELQQATVLPPITCEPEDLTIRVISAGRNSWGCEYRDIWRYRDLLYFLARRDIAIRYRQTVLGGLWALLQPLLQMVVFSYFFGKLAGLKNETGGIPYPLFSYAGILPWMLFSQTVGRASESMIGSAALVTKVYFPRMIIPLASAGACLLDFGLSFLVLIIMMVCYGVSPGAQIVILPFAIAMTMAAALGVGALLAALNVAYRDFRYVVPLMLQLWMFVTPVIYPVNFLPERWRWALALNPMTGVVEAFRSALLDSALNWQIVGISMLTSGLFIAAGAWYFNRVEEQFADII